MDLEQYLGVFVEESREHLQSLNDCLLRLEQNPGDQGILNEIFRAAHTMKGMAATMGFKAIADLTHNMETALDQLRSGRRSVNAAVIDLLFEALDSLQILVDLAAGGQGKEPDISSLVARLETWAANQPRAATQSRTAVAGGLELTEYEKATVGEALEQGQSAFVLDVTLAESCVLKTARAFLVYNNLEKVGDIVKAIPDLKDMEDENFDRDLRLLVLTDKGEEALREAVLSVAEIEGLEISALARESAPADGEVAVTVGTGQQGGKARASQTVRVNIERLDELMNLVGELVINRTRLAQINTIEQIGELKETLEYLGRVTSDLQSIVMKVRMVPIENVFSRFPRMIRDLARDLDKEVNLIVEGKETELDRTVVDEIGDPLVHLLRNAVDHGLETPAEREAIGKPRAGTVTLSARHEGNHVIIEVRDDGRGIDPARIRAKARELGLLGADENWVDDEEILAYVFRPGFSTADSVTGVSGRGVGMDVVKSRIESVGGRVELQSRPGEGTVVTIHLPLTLAIIQALLIGVRDETYAIPMGFIDEIVDVGNDRVKTVQNREVIVLRNTVLPLVELSGRLGLDGGRGEKAYVVVVRVGNKRVGLVVDTLIGQQEIVIKNLGNYLGGISGLSGATILGNGRVALILDAPGLI